MADRGRQAKTGGALEILKGLPVAGLPTYHNTTTVRAVFRRRRGGGYDAQGVVVR